MGNKMLKDSLGWLKKLFVRDWSLKILAVLLGTLSFYTIRGAISFEGFDLRAERADLLRRRGRGLV